MGFAKQWRGVNSYMIREPGSFFDKYDETHGLGYPLAFMLVSYVVVMVPLALLAMLFNVTTPVDAVMGLIGVLLVGVVFWIFGIVEAFVAHGIAFLFGARGVSRTLEAYAFPTIVRYGLWWFPLVNAGLGIYGLILQIKALASFHDVSTVKAAIAGIAAALLYLPVLVVSAAVIGTFLLDMGNTPAA